MSAGQSIVAQNIDRVLTGDLRRLERKTPTHWTGVVLNGGNHPLEVRYDGDWLLFSEPAAAGGRTLSGRELEAALGRNATAPAGVRAVLTNAGDLMNCAELFVPDGLDLEVRVPALLTAFRQYWDGVVSQPDEAPESWAVEVGRCCEESGWPCTRRSSGRLTVALETTPPWQASVTPLERGVRLEVELASLDTLPATSRTAAAVLALESSGRLRMVRAACEANRIRFAVSFPYLPGPEELGVGLAGLSAVVRATNEVLEALQIETLAGDYLAVRGWTAQQSKPKRERKKS